jgi:threonyl-tRNA synthetase
LISVTINITLPDGSQRSVSPGTPVRDFASSVLPRGGDEEALAQVDGRMVDLSFPLDRDATLKIVTAEAPKALQVCATRPAHLLARR